MHCLIFPGQGVQRRGMGAELFERHPQETEASSEVLGYPVTRLCRDNPGDRLADTRYAQPAVFLVNALSWLDLRSQGRSYDYFAGHGLGEYNALVAAGVLGLTDALALVARRARLMAGVTGGAMVAVVGLDSARVEATLHAAGLDLVHVAHRNSDRQVAVAGDRRQLALAVEALRGPEVRVLPVPAAGPFHTPLMAPAERAFTPVLRAYAFGAGHTPVMSSTTGREFAPDQAVQLLGRQLSRPVEWVRTVHALRAAGVTRFDEANGTALTAFVAQTATRRPTERHRQTPAGLPVGQW